MTRQATIIRIALGLTICFTLGTIPANAGSKEDYDGMCSACHGFGVAGAPRVGDREAWKERVNKQLETLYDNAINGFTGTTGIMPPRGGFSDLDDRRVRAIVDFMLEAVR